MSWKTVEFQLVGNMGLILLIHISLIDNLIQNYFFVIEQHSVFCTCINPSKI